MTGTATSPLLDIVAVEVLSGFNLRLTFENGEVRRFCMARLLARQSGCFVLLRNHELFRQAYIAYGTVCWPGNIDLDPELLYAQSEFEYSDTERRIGVAKGCFEVPDNPAYPWDAEWEAMPEVGLEVWPTYASDTTTWAIAQAVAKVEQIKLGSRVTALVRRRAKSTLRGTDSVPGESSVIREQRKLVLLQLTEALSLEKCFSDIPAYEALDMASVLCELAEKILMEIEQGKLNRHDKE